MVNLKFKRRSRNPPTNNVKFTFARKQGDGKYFFDKSMFTHCREILISYRQSTLKKEIRSEYHLAAVLKCPKSIFENNKVVDHIDDIVNVVENIYNETIKTLLVDTFVNYTNFPKVSISIYSKNFSKLCGEVDATSDFDFADIYNVYAWSVPNQDFHVVGGTCIVAVFKDWKTSSNIDMFLALSVFRELMYSNVFEFVRNRCLSGVDGLERINVSKVAQSFLKKMYRESKSNADLEWLKNMMEMYNWDNWKNSLDPMLGKEFPDVKPYSKIKFRAYNKEYCNSAVQEYCPENSLLRIGFKRGGLLYNIISYLWKKFSRINLFHVPIGNMLTHITKQQIINTFYQVADKHLNLENILNTIRRSIETSDEYDIISAVKDLSKHVFNPVKLPLIISELSTRLTSFILDIEKQCFSGNPVKGILNTIYTVSIKGRDETLTMDTVNSLLESEVLPVVDKTVKNFWNKVNQIKGVKVDLNFNVDKLYMNGIKPNLEMTHKEDRCFVWDMIDTIIFSIYHMGIIMHVSEEKCTA